VEEIMKKFDAIVFELLISLTKYYENEAKRLLQVKIADLKQKKYDTSILEKLLINEAFLDKVHILKTLIKGVLKDPTSNRAKNELSTFIERNSGFYAQVKPFADSYLDRQRKAREKVLVQKNLAENTEKSAQNESSIIQPKPNPLIQQLEKKNYQSPATKIPWTREPEPLRTAIFFERSLSPLTNSAGKSLWIAKNPIYKKAIKNVFSELDVLNGIKITEDIYTWARKMQSLIMSVHSARSNDARKLYLQQFRDRLNSCPDKIAILQKYGEKWLEYHQKGDVRKTETVKAAEIENTQAKNDKPADETKAAADEALSAQNDKPVSPQPPSQRLTPRKRPKRKKTNINPMSRNEALKILRNTVPAVKNYSTFSNNESNITIYIDESWPGNNSAEKSMDTGVIAGIVWLGTMPNPILLPEVGTHRKGHPKDLKNLFKCNHAMPFILPIKSFSNNAQKDYFLLIESTIKILLGWVLPQEGVKCKVQIYAEHMSGFEDGTNKTEYFNGVIATLNQQNPYRFHRFTIEKVEWQAKDFGYIPYGDLLAYLALEHNEFSKQSGEAINYKELNGYIPLSVDLFPLLQHLDLLEKMRNTDEIFHLIDELFGTKLYRYLIQDITERVLKVPELQKKLLENLETKYAQKERDLVKLRRYFTELSPMIAPLESSASVRRKLLFTLLRLQRANHDGNPEAIQSLAGSYSQLKSEALGKGEHFLAADCDLNLAVHYNDSFLFSKAFALMREWIDSSNFHLFKPEYKAFFYSSLGQAYSIEGKYEEAEAAYNGALTHFQESELENKAQEMEQTSIYRLFNALEGRLENSAADLKAFFGEEGIAAEFAKSASPALQYRHHLFLRALYERPNLKPYRDIYLENFWSWQILPYHPWQLIAFYRGLLLHPENPNQAYLSFLQAIEICKNESHGGTIALIGAVICAVGMLYFEDRQELKDSALNFLNNAQTVSGAEPQRAFLTQFIENPLSEKFNELMSLLPFNYR
jgi:hypothetical protein